MGIVQPGERPIFFVVMLAMILVLEGFSFFGIVEYVYGAESSDAVLTTKDCAKCHKKEFAAIRDNGVKHRSEVTCLDCHIDHPLLGEQIIPKCSQCHSGKKHYELTGCLSCHSDPHQPMEIIIKGEVTEPCLSCHPKQGEELKDYASFHSELSCNYCHDKHGYIPECFKCHEPHLEGQTLSECLGCHPAHLPLHIQYPLQTPSSHCAPCHEKQSVLMKETYTKHRVFTCAFCHRGIHTIIPECFHCHGEPHSPSIHRTMPDCITCHLDPHNLKT